MLLCPKNGQKHISMHFAALMVKTKFHAFLCSNGQNCRNFILEAHFHAFVSLKCSKAHLDAFYCSNGENQIFMLFGAPMAKIAQIFC